MPEWWRDTSWITTEFPFAVVSPEGRRLFCKVEIEFVSKVLQKKTLETEFFMGTTTLWNNSQRNPVYLSFHQFHRIWLLHAKRTFLCITSWNKRIPYYLFVCLSILKKMKFLLYFIVEEKREKCRMPSWLIFILFFPWIKLAMFASLHKKNSFLLQP